MNAHSLMLHRGEPMRRVFHLFSLFLCVVLMDVENSLAVLPVLPVHSDEWS